MAITLSDYPAISSPGACPKCGSMDLHTPFHGRRTELWLSTCRDCRTPIRSREYFTVERRTIRFVVSREPSESDFAQLRAVRDSALTKLNMRDPKLRQMREIGEEG